MQELRTTFFDEKSRFSPLIEYPRPQMVRDSYISLNGIWDYAIVPSGGVLGEYDGEIVVPYSPECLLSDVVRQVTPTDTLYYHREFDYTRDRADGRVLLHFDAVDYRCTVRLNDIELGAHIGGYLPFYYDITDALREHNDLYVTVTDPSDSEPISRGKQRLRSGGIFYTAQSGIWQSVWIEEVAPQYIERLKMTPHIDTGTLDLDVYPVGDASAMDVEVSLRGESVLSCHVDSLHTSLEIGDVELWSPDHPTLYDIDIKMRDDHVRSYFAMREYGMIEDAEGYARITLNGEPIFMSGVLDQGYWSDGLMTPPSDEAMIYDISTMKDMGFNMVRKHIKIEPLRWYYHCDRLGMIVWQDFVNSGDNVSIARMSMLGMMRVHVNDSRYGFFGRRDEASRHRFVEDIAPTIEHLYNAPCIAVWIPFNEGWGQFDSVAVSDRVHSLDPTRLIDHASGWFDQGAGDFRSMHVYGMPIKMPRDARCKAVTEFGGYSLNIEGHVAIDRHAFGYKKIKSKEDLMRSIERLYRRDIEGNIAKGLCVAIYTQLSDVENEINGLLTYDRQVEKVDRASMRRVNERLYAELTRVISTK